MSDATDPILGASRAASAIRDFARLAAAVDAPVLITGETGTGKGALAQAIHGASARAARALVAVNCAGVPESLFESEFFGHARGAFTGAHAARRGLFEQADAGTLFLDEIGELSLSLQAKLLTAIEEGEVRRLGGESTRRVDARIIAATGVELEAAVADGSFRMDLYHRLLVLAFHMPPLRERAGDILLLARHFVSVFAARHHRRIGDLHPDTVALLERLSWPGNIRQLAHAMEAAVLMSAGAAITPRDLPPRLLGSAVPATTAPGRYSFYGSPDEERTRILAALREQHGNMTRAARKLGMSRNTLRSRMGALAIPPPRGSPQHR